MQDKEDIPEILAAFKAYEAADARRELARAKLIEACWHAFRTGASKARILRSIRFNRSRTWLDNILAEEDESAS